MEYHKTSVKPFSAQITLGMEKGYTQALISKEIIWIKMEKQKGIWDGYGHYLEVTKVKAIEVTKRKELAKKINEAKKNKLK